jgi:hypothetical protein
VLARIPTPSPLGIIDIGKSAWCKQVAGEKRPAQPCKREAGKPRSNPTLRSSRDTQSCVAVARG